MSLLWVVRVPLCLRGTVNGFTVFAVRSTRTLYQRNIVCAKLFQIRTSAKHLKPSFFVCCCCWFLLGVATFITLIILLLSCFFSVCFNTTGYAHRHVGDCCNLPHSYTNTPQLQQYHRKPILTVVVGKRPEVLQCEPLPGFVEVHVAVVYCQQLVRLVK